MKLLSRTIIELAHNRTMQAHGGLRGIRDEGAMEATLAKPQHLIAYGDAPDLADIAAAYGFGFVQNHVFNDGNKRMGLLTLSMALRINSHVLTASQAEAVVAIMQVATGELDQAGLAEWVRANMVAMEIVSEDEITRQGPR